MGIEGSGASKPPVQGEAGYLTQEQLDELDAPTIEASKDSETAEPANAESGLFDTAEMRRTAEVLGGTPAPEPVEAGPEIMEQIGEQEQRLAQNLEENSGALEAAEAKIAAVDPETLEAGALLKYRVMKEKVNNAYDKVKTGLNGLMAGGLITGLGTAAVGSLMSIRATEMINNYDVAGTQLMELSQRVAEGGILLGTATAAVWAIGHSINWLAKRSGEKKADKGWQNDIAQIAK